MCVLLSALKVILYNIINRTGGLWQITIGADRGRRPLPSLLFFFGRYATAKSIGTTAAVVRIDGSASLHDLDEQKCVSPPNSRGASGKRGIWGGELILR
jgi:hypothetical protein